MFLGLWEVIPVKVPKHLGLTTINFSRVFINGASMTFSGGDQGKIDDDVQTISIHQTPGGTVYLDDKGSKLKKFEPQNGVIKVKNIFGMTVMFKRSSNGASEVPLAGVPEVPVVSEVPSYPMTNQPPSYSTDDPGLSFTQNPNSLEKY